MADTGTGNAGWSGTTPKHAPVADPTLIARAYSEGGLDPSQPLSALFVRPSPEARAFFQGLSKRAQASLENAASAEGILIGHAKKLTTVIHQCRGINGNGPCNLSPAQKAAIVELLSELLVSGNRQIADYHIDHRA